MTMLVHYSFFKNEDDEDPKFQGPIAAEISDREWMEQKGYVELSLKTKAGHMYVRFKLSELIAEVMQETVELL